MTPMTALLETALEKATRSVPIAAPGDTAGDVRDRDRRPDLRMR